MPRVTVVTAAYNAAPFIAEAIESVFAQTYTDFEYIVVDDGSSDDTAAIVARYLPRLSLIRQGNAGEGPARNRGFELAHGEYVAVIDADDVWAANKLERQVAAMDRQPDAGLSYTNSSKIRPDGSLIQTFMIGPHGPLTCLDALTGHNSIVNSSVLYRRRYLEARPYTNLRVGADFVVNMKVLWRSGQQSVFIDEPLTRYRIVETSVLARVEAWARGRAELEAVETFIRAMRHENPLPHSMQTRAIARAHFDWAWFCIEGRVRYTFAMHELGRAVRGDPRLLLAAGLQLVKLVRNACVLRPKPNTHSTRSRT